MISQSHIKNTEGGFTVEKAAYHEAGHAVASVYLGLPFDYVSIEADGEELGHVSYPNRRFTGIPFFASECCHFGAMCASCDEKRIIAEAAIVFELAGPIAQGSYQFRDNGEYGDAGDQATICEISRVVFNDDTDEKIANRVHPLLGRAQLMMLSARFRRS